MSANTFPTKHIPLALHHIKQTYSPSPLLHLKLNGQHLMLKKSLYNRSSPFIVCTSLTERLQELLESVGNVSHHVARVAVFGQQERQLQVWVLF